VACANAAIATDSGDPTDARRLPAELRDWNDAIVLAVQQATAHCNDQLIQLRWQTSESQRRLTDDLA